MKLFLVALILFLLAFTGLAIGLIFKRKGPRSSCGHAQSTKQNCRCESEIDAKAQEQVNCCTKEKET